MKSKSDEENLMLKKMVCRGKSSVVSERQREQKNSSDINVSKEKSEKSDEVEHVKLYANILRFFSVCAKCMGIELNYYWIPHKHFIFWITCIFNCFTWFSIVYTAYVHINSGDTLRILEPFAVCGVAVAVI